jgi:ABC-type oligopeptide transport system substrate-binding subunit
MRRYDKFIFAFLLCCAMLMTACSTQSSSAQNAMDYKTLLKTLQAHDTTVVPDGDVSQSFMNAQQGHIVKIQGEQIQVYEYVSASDANTQTSHMSPDGSTFTFKTLTGTHGTAVDWIAPPHFYKQGRVIVLYVGRNNSIMQTLTKVVGKQFAGA